MGQLDGSKPIRCIKVPSLQPRPVQTLLQKHSLGESEKRVRSLRKFHLRTSHQWFCLRLLIIIILKTQFFHLSWGKVSATTLVQQHRGFLFIYTINHFVPKSKTEWPGKKKTNPEREETRKKRRKRQRWRQREGSSDALVFLIWSRLFTVGLPSGFHQGFMYNLT